MPAEHRTLVLRNNGDVLPTLLIDGHVAGVWRPMRSRSSKRASRLSNGKPIST
jgi:hypothetical protein